MLRHRLISLLLLCLLLAGCSRSQPELLPPSAGEGAESLPEAVLTAEEWDRFLTEEVQTAVDGAAARFLEESSLDASLDASTQLERAYQLISRDGGNDRLLCVYSYALYEEGSSSSGGLRTLITVEGEIRFSAGAFSLGTLEAQVNHAPLDDLLELLQEQYSSDYQFQQRG